MYVCSSTNGPGRNKIYENLFSKNVGAKNIIKTNISELEAILLIFQAWERVTESTIQNCFRHTGFNNEIQQLVEQEEQKEEISLPNIGGYVNIDNDVLTSE